jgi:protoporphyrinogen oxidase
VVVVGGGLSGLTTAYLILKHAPGRFRVTVLEAEPVPGGQARGFQVDGHTVEHGSHAFFGYYKNSVALLEELGTRKDTVEIDGWTIVDAYGRATTLRQSRWLPRVISVAPSILRVPWFSIAEKLRTLWGAYRLVGKPYSSFAELDRQSAWELGTSLGYPPIGLFTWNSASLGLTNLFIKEQSGAIFTGKHKVLIGTPRGLDYLLPSTNLSRLLAEPLARRIVEMGGKVKYETRATALEPGRVVHGAGATAADRVVLAVQPRDAHALLPDRAEPWTTLGPVTPVITMTLALDGRIAASRDGREYGFSREHWAFSVVTDLSRFWPEYAGERTVLRVEVGHADRMPNGALVDEQLLLTLVKRDLDRFWPEAEPLSIAWAKLHRETKHLYVSWTKGEWEKRPQSRVVREGVFMTGDWTTKGTIGMEAAVNSAYEAAAWLLSGAGLVAPKFVDVPL